MSEAEVVDGWYISHDDELDGPLSDAQLQRGFEAGRYKGEHFVWRQGMEAWVEAQSVPALSAMRAARRDAPARAAVEQRVSDRRAERAERSGQRAAEREQRRQAPGRARGAIQLPSSGRARAERGGPEPVREPERDTTPPEFPAKLPPELGKVIDKLKKQTGGIPPLAIGLFVAGFIFPILLPILWFMAWKVYTNARDKRA